MRAFFTQLGSDFISVRDGGLDPLLTAARVLLYILLAGVTVATVVSVLGLIIYVSAQFPQLFLQLAPAEWKPVVAHLIGLVALGLMSSSILLVLGIIGAVERRDTFEEVNGKRLEKIAGNVLGLQLLGLFATLIGSPIGGDINGFDIGLSLSPGGVAIVLLLFILARVFGQGAAMRHDLEGTV